MTPEQKKRLAIGHCSCGNEAIQRFAGSPWCVDCLQVIFPPLTPEESASIRDHYASPAGQATIRGLKDKAHSERTL